MKKLFNLRLIIVSAIAFLFSCSGNSGQNTQSQSAKSIAKPQPDDTYFLNDRNYVYHDITNTEKLQFIGHRLANGNFDPHVYIDSTFKRYYVELNAGQKAKLIQKFFSRLMKVDSSYAVNQMEAFFVSKQKRIGNLQPLIIKIGGDDYGSLTMIILDKNNVYVSGYNISGGFNSGPDEKGDSLETYEARSYSRLDNNKISTWYIYETDPMDTVKTTASIDSNAFESIVNADGSISTKQVGRGHYIIPYKENIKRKQQH